MKKVLFAASLGLALCLADASAEAYEALQGPTEMLLWNKAKAFNGYTLFAAHGKTYVIDMSGQVVHTWSLGTNPKLLADGHILDASKDDPSGFGGLQELDWDGKSVWTYTEKRAGYAMHHDFIRLHNKKLGAYTTMYIANKTITKAEALAVGADPANAGTGTDGKQSYENAQVDTIVEVDSTGTVIWEWRFIDHLVQDTSSAFPNYAGTFVAGATSVSKVPGRLDVNLPGRPLRSDWLHCNSMDYNEENDQVVINAVGGEFYVIDHGATFTANDPAGSVAAAATSKGDFLYRYGDPARYKAGTAPSIPLNWTAASTGHKQIGGAHDIHWIRPGLPGAGNFLVFNNGQYLNELTNQSYADEINPYLDSSGATKTTFVDPPTAGYTTYTPPKDTAKPTANISKQRVWRFGAKSPQGMSSNIGGSVQRLPNGNTLICSDTEGHFIEVTSGLELVWEYISPLMRDSTTGAVSAAKIMGDNLPMVNSVFRAYRYAADDAAFAGRTLNPTGLITDQVAAPDAGVPDTSIDDTGSGDAGTSDAATTDGGADTATPSACTCPSDTAGGCQAADGARAGSGGRAWLLVIPGLIAALGALRLRRVQPQKDLKNS